MREAGPGGASAREAGPGLGVLPGGFAGAGPGPGAFGAPVWLGLGLKGSGRRDGDGGRPTLRCGGSSVGLRGCKRGVGRRGRWDPWLARGRWLRREAEAAAELVPEGTTGAGGGARETCGRGAGPEWPLVRKPGSRCGAGPGEWSPGKGVPPSPLSRRVRVAAGVWGFPRILGASRGASGPEGPARPPCAFPESNSGLSCPGYLGWRPPVHRHAVSGTCRFSHLGDFSCCCCRGRA